MKTPSRRRQASVCPKCGRVLAAGDVLRHAGEWRRHAAKRVLALEVAELAGELEALVAHMAEQRTTVARMTKEKRTLERRLRQLKAR